MTKSRLDEVFHLIGSKRGLSFAVPITGRREGYQSKITFNGSFYKLRCLVSGVGFVSLQ